MLDFEKIMIPIWDTSIIYDESMALVEEDGKATAKFLFEPKKIISVTSADKTENYEIEKDYIIENDKLVLTKGSRIFYFKDSDLVFNEEVKGKSFERIDGKYSLFSEGHFFHDRQISVTYVAKRNDFGFKQEYCGHMLPETVNKLKNREPVKIVLYGDSISAGANSSGTTLTTPFLPTWGDLVAENLRRCYNNTAIELINTSVGGVSPNWAIENAKERVADYKPDLAIIAFGMNGSDTGEKLAKKVAEIKKFVLKECKDTEFILCATTLPNKNLKYFYEYQYEHFEALLPMACEGTAIANFRDLQLNILKKKKLLDITGNNVNHPNDFMVRCHAQLISAMLVDGRNKKI